MISQPEARSTAVNTPATRQTPQEREDKQRWPRPSPPPRLSVIICTYNRRNMVLGALGALRKQSLPRTSFEVIVVDNGSTDGTAAALHAYIRTDAMQPLHPEEVWQVRCLEEPQNGLAYARNRAVQAAAGEILVFLDDDALADPTLLERLLNAYEESGASVVGGCVELRWEAPRPYWLSNDLLDLFGYFVPFRTRCELPSSLNLSSACFSLTRTALQQVGGFVPFLSKRLHTPLNGEMADLCRRLRAAGYTLWYEPEAVVRHRVTRPRLVRAFIVGRSYWQGRSEILADYLHHSQQTPNGQAGTALSTTLRNISPDLREFLRLALLQRPRLFLTRGANNEALHAAMAQAYRWGRVQQQLMLIDRAPALMSPPALLLVSAGEQEEPGATCLARTLIAQGIECLPCTGQVPLAWLWRHRSTNGQAVGIVHCYRPGAFKLTWSARLAFLAKLRLARLLGVCVVSTDVGGWWQSGDTLHGRQRRIFEQKVLKHSQLIHTYTRHPEQLYAQEKLQQHARPTAHPGMRGLFAEVPESKRAREYLGLPAAHFVYLCIASQHTEREIVRLITAFAEASRVLEQRAGETFAPPQLLIAGMPSDRREARKLLRSAALVPGVHLCTGAPAGEELAYYLGAADALALPHGARPQAGTVDMAMLFYSYERVIVAPNLPRLRGMLPTHACVFYDAASMEGLVAALLTTPGRTFKLKEKEATALEIESGWQQHAHRLMELYKPLLNRQKSQ